MPDLQPDNPRVLAVLDAIGWGSHLKELGGLFYVRVDQGWEADMYFMVALSLIERRLRVWLAEHGVGIELYSGGKWPEWLVRKLETLECIHLGNWSDCGHCTFDCYLTAQITAAEALLKEMT